MAPAVLGNSAAGSPRRLGCAGTCGGAVTGFAAFGVAGIGVPAGRAALVVGAAAAAAVPGSGVSRAVVPVAVVPGAVVPVPVAVVPLAVVPLAVVPVAVVPVAVVPVAVVLVAGVAALVRVRLAAFEPAGVVPLLRWLRRPAACRWPPLRLRIIRTAIVRVLRSRVTVCPCTGPPIVTAAPGIGPASARIVLIPLPGWSAGSARGELICGAGRPLRSRPGSRLPILLTAGVVAG